MKPTDEAILGMASESPRHLIRRIEESPAIVLHSHVDLVALEGDAPEACAVAKHRGTDRIEMVHVFSALAVAHQCRPESASVPMSPATAM